MAKKKKEVELKEVSRTEIKMCIRDRFESLSSDNVEVVTSLIRHIFKEKTLFLITH